MRKSQRFLSFSRADVLFIVSELMQNLLVVDSAFMGHLKMNNKLKLQKILEVYKQLKTLIVVRESHFFKKVN